MNNNTNKNMSLVVWGSNLYSTVGVRMTIKELKVIALPILIRSIIVGLLLSDGYLIIKGNSKNASFAITQSLSHFGYAYFIFEHLMHYCSRYPILRKRKGNRFNIETFSLEIYTRSMPCLTELYNIYYSDNKKCFKDLVYNDLTPVALAHWVMGDGTFNGISLLLCTDSFTIKETVILMNVLFIKYDISCTIRYYNNKYPRIYIYKSQMPKIISIIKPYMHKSMMYKLGNY